MAVIAISNFLPLLSGFGKRHKFHATLVRILTKTDLVRTFVSENLRVQDFNELCGRKLVAPLIRWRGILMCIGRSSTPRTESLNWRNILPPLGGITWTWPGFFKIMVRS